ncbi:MAG: PilZ domain-containing protein [Deltaproteobacteria bacterium]|jgi:hypothetical protein|nr:PilZ domain-containing protein [Deltaproteobacteria bacterium]
MADSEFTKSFVRPDITAVLTCPYCGHQKEVSAEPFRGHKNKLKVKCYCKESFKVFLEFRKKVRKAVHLGGTYINHTKNGSICRLMVLDVSLIGITFSSLDPPDFSVGDELSIEFTLDDGHKTQIKREAVIKNVRPGGIIGAEFEPVGATHDAPLGYYINHAK